MKKKHGMDIYIVDQSNTVVYTTFTKDIGLISRVAVNVFLLYWMNGALVANFYRWN